MASPVQGPSLGYLPVETALPEIDDSSSSTPSISHPHSHVCPNCPVTTQPLLTYTFSRDFIFALRYGCDQTVQKYLDQFPREGVIKVVNKADFEEAVHCCALVGSLQTIQIFLSFLLARKENHLVKTVVLETILSFTDLVEGKNIQQSPKQLDDFLHYVSREIGDRKMVEMINEEIIVLAFTNIVNYNEEETPFPLGSSSIRSNLINNHFGILLNLITSRQLLRFSFTLSPDQKERCYEVLERCIGEEYTDGLYRILPVFWDLGVIGQEQITSLYQDQFSQSYCVSRILLDFAASKNILLSQKPTGQETI